MSEIKIYIRLQGVALFKLLDKIDCEYKTPVELVRDCGVLWEYREYILKENMYSENGNIIFKIHEEWDYYIDIKNEILTFCSNRDTITIKLNHIHLKRVEFWFKINGIPKIYPQPYKNDSDDSDDELGYNEKK